jgi:hypothetical protein
LTFASSDPIRPVTGNVHLPLVLVAAVAAIAAPRAGAVGAAQSQPPTFVDVTPVVVTNVNGVRNAVVDYALPLAQDASGVPLPVLCDPPPGSTFDLGDTDVNCTATDADGAEASTSFVVRVLDDVPPPAATDVVIRGDRSAVKLTWRLPVSTDIAGTEIVRYPGAFVVFHGPGTSFSDTDVRPGSNYRYRVASYDWADNHGLAVDVHTTAKQTKLIQPQDWAQLTQPPLLAWANAPGADYYNVQVWTIAPSPLKKVLSIWPTSSHLQLTSRWTYGGKSYRLEPGRYRWYVWPGLGLQKQGRYGALIGSHVFVIGR